jgi:hypothetical protein
MGLFDFLKKKPTPAAVTVAAAPPPPRNIVQGEDGPIDFGRVSPDDDATFARIMAEYQKALDSNQPGASERVAQTWGFDPHQFADMRHHMRRRSPGLGASVGNAPATMPAAGGAPCSYERYIEVRGAMNAWTMNSADIDGNLQRYFQITRNDVNYYALHWGTADIAKAMEQAAQMAVVTQRYLQMPM